MVKSKDRRHSGWYTPTATCSPKELKANNLEIVECYDDWSNYRDSMRDWYRDFKMIKRIHPRRRWSDTSVREAMNKKQERLLKRRQRRKANDKHTCA